MGTSPAPVGASPVPTEATCHRFEHFGELVKKGIPGLWVVQAGQQMLIKRLSVCAKKWARAISPTTMLPSQQENGQFTRHSIPKGLHSVRVATVKRIYVLMRSVFFSTKPALWEAFHASFKRNSRN